MWPFQKKKPTEELALWCVTIVKSTLAGLDVVAKPHFSELLALSYFSCCLGLRAKFSKDRKGSSNAEHTFQRLLICDLVEAGLTPNRTELTQFLESRYKSYNQCVQQNLQELGQWNDDIAKDIAIVFEQTVRGPDANHTPNADDALDVLTLRREGSQVVLTSIALVQTDWRKLGKAQGK